MKFFLNLLLHKYNYTLTKKTNSLEKKERIFKSFIGHGKPLIMDIGAHKGETVNDMKKIFPMSEVHCFEPDPKTFQELRTNTLKYNNVFLNNYAIGAHNKEKKIFYRHSHSKLNSLKKININGQVITEFLNKQKNISTKNYNNQIYVKLKKLDTYCKKNKIKNIDILKIDVQSGEREVLIGSKNILNKTSIIFTEINFFDMYETRYNFLDLESFLIPKGFNLFSLVRVNNNKNSGEITFVEAIYVKDNVSQLMKKKKGNYN